MHAAHATRHTPHAARRTPHTPAHTGHCRGRKFFMHVPTTKAERVFLWGTKKVSLVTVRGWLACLHARTLACALVQPSLLSVGESVAKAPEPTPNATEESEFVLPVPFPFVDQSASLYNGSVAGHAVYVDTVQDIQKLTVVWPIPPQMPHYQTKSVELIASLLGDEGTGSLFSALYHEGYANQIWVGVSQRTAEFDFFEVRVPLSVFSVQCACSVRACVRVLGAGANFSDRCWSPARGRRSQRHQPVPAPHREQGREALALAREREDRCEFLPLPLLPLALPLRLAAGGAHVARQEAPRPAAGQARAPRLRPRPCAPRPRFAGAAGVTVARQTRSILGLLIPERMVVTVSAPDHVARGVRAARAPLSLVGGGGVPTCVRAHVKLDRVEPFYATKFALDDLDLLTLNKDRTANVVRPASAAQPALARC